MKSLVLMSFLLLQAFAGYSSEQDGRVFTKSNGENASEATARSTASPAYTGGNQAFLNFISKNIRYPLAARTKKTQGRVTVRFMVDADGNIKNAMVPKGMGIGDGCDEEAIRVVMLSSKWKPAVRAGIPSAMWYEVPIVFALTE